LKEKADFESERWSNAKKEHVNLTRELASLKDKISRETLLKPEAVDEKVVKQQARREAELSVEITLKDLEIQAAESEQAKARDQISTTHTRLLAAQEESSKRDTSKTTQVQRIRTSQRNSGSLFIPLSNKIVFFNACQ